MPSKIRENKLNTPNKKYGTSSNKNKNKTYQKIITLVNAIALLNKIINIVRNKPMNPEITTLLNKLARDMEIMENMVNVLKTKVKK
ncbi:hypothetical protein QLL95_gp0039 [Cotonvirus japonicus]|uniref:Uncharacterized protein n=1 Tax=Cotonvirus japonicus TaxID=2811091 RepID=A0ABM7NQU0_9VIRU|nr:hypothetical protein QLL95_gp0039 [Cotonvirus japonicus]BCS82528.1 hypothetical protein [Cotonvirus japonicus]